MRIVGQERIAEVFGVAPKTIVEWQEGGLPIAKRGGPGVPSEYDSEACIKWLVDREVGKVAAAESPRDRLFRLQGDALEREAAIQRGILVRPDAVEPRLRTAVLAAREFLARAAPGLAQQLDGLGLAQREALLRQAFEEFLRRLANLRALDEDDRVPHDSASVTD